MVTTRDELTEPAPPRERRRRRRPTGAPPPLPKKIGATGKLWAALSVAFVVWMLVLAIFPKARRWTDKVDTAILQRFAELRTDWLTTVMTRIDRIGTGWALTILAVGLLVALLVFRRWRHLFTFVGTIFVLEIVGQIVYNGFSRSRPYGVTIIGRWAGFSFPSPPVLVLTAVLIGVIYSLVVPGRPRRQAKIVVGVVVTVFALARLYLGVDHPFDILAAVAPAVALPLAAFRIFTSSETVPVTYKRGKTAHLDVTGRRGEAIRQAVRDQLGLTVLDAKPVGLEGSGGSTPLRLHVETNPDRYLFAKLYTMTHVRSDRWYKLGRQILYGRLEDEARFQSVRRLIEYEDYAFRLLRDVGIPTAEPFGIVEITPEREYMLVNEFLAGAHEIGDPEVDVDDDTIEQGLLLIRRLWDAGLSHRDIKPANLMVRDGRVYLIDAFFVQVRPSPWRQAVDLANMMLVLAVRTDPERVYNRALEYFTPDDIAEAFAATRGVASPTQLRMAMKQDGRDLLAEFRSLAPPRAPISLQRWSIRRVAMAFGLLLLALIVIPNVIGMFAPTHDVQVNDSPLCPLDEQGQPAGTSDLMELFAQSVPSATLVPCVATEPAGWDVSGVHVRNGRARFFLDSDIAGYHAVEVTLRPESACDLFNSVQVQSDEVGTERHERPERLPPALRTTRIYLFPGGCVTYQFDFAEEATTSAVFEADQALAFQPRQVLVDHVREESDLELCGAGAPCPGG
jgi:hypothetical protein